jgi:flagellar biosynthesis protein FliP
LLLSVVLFCLFENAAFAQDLAGTGVDMAEEVRDMPVSSTIRLLFILASLTFVPAIMLAMTPFTRFIIVFFYAETGYRFAASPSQSGSCWFVFDVVFYDYADSTNRSL